MASTLTCFARGRPGEWEAICLDYDIAVQGRTFAEVDELLEAAIDDYIETARQETPEIRDRLLSRSAPLRVRLAYVFGFMLHSLIRRSNVKYNIAAPLDDEALIAFLVWVLQRPTLH